MDRENRTYKAMGYSSKADLKQALDDESKTFEPEILQRIIDCEFFDDTNPMDIELIDAASRRLAAIKGISAEEQYKETAHSALKKLFHKGE